MFGSAAAAVLWLSLCPLAVPDSLTGDRLIGGSPGGAQEEEERAQRARGNDDGGGCQAIVHSPAFTPTPPAV